MALTHYGTIGVDRASTTDEIKAAYRAKASEMHPDRGGDADQMAALNVAYEVLMDEASRKHYDELLEVIGTKCGQCDGQGRRYKQKGFHSRTAVSCKSCNGEGFTAVRAHSTSVMRLGGAGAVKKKKRAT